MAASEVASFVTNFFRIAGTSEAETSVTGKAGYLLAIGEDKKVSFMEWPFPLKFSYLSEIWKEQEDDILNTTTFAWGNEDQRNMKILVSERRLKKATKRWENINKLGEIFALRVYFYAILCYDDVLCFTMCYLVLCCIMLCHVSLCCTMLFYWALCCAVLLHYVVLFCYVAPCGAKLCYVA